MEESGVDAVNGTDAGRGKAAHGVCVRACLAAFSVNILTRTRARAKRSFSELTNREIHQENALPVSPQAVESR